MAALEHQHQDRERQRGSPPRGVAPARQRLGAMGCASLCRPWRCPPCCVPMGGGGEIEAAADLGGERGERRRRELGEAARPRRRVVEHLDDAAGPRRHHGDPVGEKHRLADRMGDEHHGLAALHPDALQLGRHLLAGDGVERRERLVHDQELADRAPARARSRRGAACRRTVRTDISCRSRRGRPSAAAPARARSAALRSSFITSTGSSTFSSMVRHGSSTGAWNTAPTPRDGPAISRPSTRQAAARRAFQPEDELEQARLAAAARADHGDEFAVADVERDAAQRFDRRPTWCGRSARRPTRRASSRRRRRGRCTSLRGRGLRGGLGEASMSTLLTSAISEPLKKSAYLVSSGLRPNSGPAKAISLFQSASVISPQRRPSFGCLKIDSVFSMAWASSRSALRGVAGRLLEHRVVVARRGRGIELREARAERDALQAAHREIAARWPGSALLVTNTPDDTSGEKLRNFMPRFSSPAIAPMKCE